MAQLFARATEGFGPSLQDYARLTVDGLAHTYAAAYAEGDHGIAVRALRELRALLQFYALVPVDRLRAHAGWHEPPVPRDPIFDLERLLLASVAGSTAEEAAALAALDARHPGFAADWPSFQ
ncbi:hypothetical protein [Methylobacterium cerastii]|uniref:hypothetical protein n=1 Tax=Methylobacterium cerastii TaxID=932741 RepID=UPI001EE24693|nr:hypothetical protein [Methylobacterium cerastii]